MGRLLKEAALIFFLASGLFLFLQAGDTFADPDSFYHLKMAQLGPQKSFPWFQTTVLKDYYTDQHFLYHLLLPTTFAGAKIFTALAGASFFVIFYLLLRILAINYAFWFTLPLFFYSPFIFRLSLTKASALVLLFLWLGLIFLVKKRNFFFLPLGFFYVWLHGGFILLPLVSLFFRRLKPFFFSSAGIALGLIINPYFPQNLKFYWQQLVQIGILNYKNKIEVGAEWYAYHPVEFLGATSLLLIFFVLALTIFIFYYRQQDSFTWSLFFLSSFFLIITLKSQRYVEYFVPFTYLFSLVVLADYLKGNFRQHWSSFLGWQKKHKVLVRILAFYFFFALAWSAGKSIWDNKRELADGFKITLYQGAMNYLKENTLAGEVIFHQSWDDGPILFYQNDKNYYLVGLDTTFMYNYDRRLYQIWRDLGEGKIKENIGQVIRENFHTRYAFVSKNERSKLLWAYLKRDKTAKLVYEDDQALVFVL